MVAGRRTLLALLVALLLIAPGESGAMPAYVPVLQPGDTVPDLPLLDQRSRPLSLQNGAGRMTAVAFIYTRCGDPRMCPLVSAKFSRLQHLVDPARVRLVLVTLDPLFDRPPVLLRYGKGFGEQEDRWLFAWGAPAVVDELSRRLGIISLPAQSGGLTHTEALVFIDARGRIADRIDGNAWSADGAFAEIEGLLDRPANPLAVVMLALSRGVSALCGGKSGLTLGAMLLLFVIVLGALALIARRLMRAAALMLCVAFVALASTPARSATTAELARGRYLVVYGSCNACHTPGWTESDGDVPVARWLTGSRIGFRGPWGTVYPTNLRIRFQEISEAQWLFMIGTRGGHPPMKWTDMRVLTPDDQRAIYQFIRSLGPSGVSAPPDVPPGRAPGGSYYDVKPSG